MNLITPLSVREFSLLGTTASPLFDNPVVVIWLGACILLAIGTGVRRVALRRADAEERQKRLGSLVVWWVIVGATGLLAFAGAWAAAAIMVLISSVGMREFLRMVDSESVIARPWLVTTVLPAAIHLIAASPFVELHLALPALILVALAISQWSSSGAPKFSSAASLAFWGIMLIAYGPSWLVAMVRLANEQGIKAPAGGWLVFLIFQVILNDISQALFGRRWGRHKITPLLSPGKTWEGFFGGALVTFLAVAISAPWITSLGQDAIPVIVAQTSMELPAWLGTLGAAIVIVVFGFCGDITMSAVKRDVGVKDTGHWIPSQGGMLDRIDSLTFVAPMLFWYARWLGVL